MNDQQNVEIAEDTPQYMSVMMSPLSAPPMPRSFARQTKVQPMQKVKEPTLSVAVWTVSNLPALPAEHLLERTNVYVDCNSQEVADRICNCLRLKSIAAIADNNDKNLLAAETSECVKFAVRLFADNGMVVVEVQRKCGCSFEFHETANAVLKCAKGIQSTAPKRKFTLPSCIPRDTMEQKQKRVEDGLEASFNMLDSDRSDSQLLGMESLEQITRSCECRSTAAKTVLAGKCLRKLLSAAQADGSEGFTDMEERHSAIMKRRALAVLANALCALSESKDLKIVLGCTDELKSESLIASLVSTLSESSSCPHEASQAARCMQYLLSAREVEAILVDMSAIGAISSACTVGVCRSATLERETKKLKLQLSSCI